MRETTKSEFKEGLSETRRYILSHHQPEEYNKCYTIRTDGRTIRLCARCLGIYPGIVVGVFIYFFEVFPDYQLLLVVTLPVFALADWVLTTFTDLSGWNSTRTITGLLLGTAYGLGLCQLFLSTQLIIILIGAIYGSTAATLLWKQVSGL